MFPTFIFCLITHDLHTCSFTRCSFPPPPSALTASQSNISLKKQRNRGIFSTFFCCFRNYNVEPPAVNTSSLPPPVEENGSPPKVCRRAASCSCCASCRPEAPLLSGFCCPHPPFLSVFICLSYCSVTRSRSFLSLVYVSPVLFGVFFFLAFCMHAEWAGAGTSFLRGLRCRCCV